MKSEKPSNVFSKYETKNRVVSNIDFKYHSAHDGGSTFLIINKFWIPALVRIFEGLIYKTVTYISRRMGNILNFLFIQCLLAVIPAMIVNAGNPPNVVLIITDDQGWGDIHSHGNDLIDTPVLDNLANSEARFDRFYVSLVCSPTRAALLTGRYAARSGVFRTTRGMDKMRLDEITIADVFKKAGYKTGCFGKWHNGAQYPYQPNGRGFDEFFGFCNGHIYSYFDVPLLRNGKRVETKGFITDLLTDEAMNFIEDHHSDRFFCYIPYNTLHFPKQVPDK